MKKKTRFVYLVYANPVHPLVYGVYTSKKAALRYATQLINYRFDRAFKNGWEHGFYHEHTEDKRSENDHDRREKYIYSACLKIKDGATPDKFSDDGTLIQVVRRPISK